MAADGAIVKIGTGARARPPGSGRRPRAFGELARRLRERLANQVQARLSERIAGKVEPEDVVQDTLAVAFASIESFEWHGEESFYRWLASIAEHLVWSSSQKKAWSEIALLRDLPDAEASRAGTRAEGSASSVWRRRWPS